MFDTLDSLRGQHITVTLECGNEYSGNLTMLTKTVFRLERTKNGKAMRRILLVKNVTAVDHEINDERNW